MYLWHNPKEKGGEQDGVDKEKPANRDGNADFLKGTRSLSGQRCGNCGDLMSITTLRGFQREHTEELLSKFAQTSRELYLEAGDALKTEP